MTPNLTTGIATSTVIISRLRQPPPIVLTVDGSVICKVPSVNYLGVSVSSDLSWMAHIDSVCSKAKRQVGLLHRQFHNASPTCKDQLYKSLVLPVLNYCSSLWDPNYAIHVSKLESVQKFAARFVTGRWSDSYDSLLSHLKWPKLSTKREKQKLLLCNRILKNCSILPPSLFIPHPSPILDTITHLLCTIPLVTQLPTYPHLLSVLYHCGIVYLLMLFVPPVFTLLKRGKSLLTYCDLHPVCTSLVNFLTLMIVAVILFLFWFLFIGQP